MPSAKSIASMRYRDMRATYDPSGASSTRRFSSIWLLIGLVLAVFMGKVAYDVHQDVALRESEEDKEAKMCLVDFQSKSCNPLEMDTKCDRLYRCFNKTNLLFLFKPSLFLDDFVLFIVH